MKNYIIIGASSGIGAASASLLAANNQVFGSYNSHPVSNTTNCTYFPYNVLTDNIDVLQYPEVIDGIVYCPGSINLKPFARIKPEDFVQDYQLQVVGAIKVIQAILPKLKLSSTASIVLFSTVAVQNGLNFHSLVAASKGAVEGLTKSLAAELAPTIRVNCIAPGLTNTPLAASLLNTPEKIEANAQRHPLKKIGTPQDIAYMVEYLLSEKAGWITGQVLHVDGGMDGVKM